MQTIFVLSLLFVSCLNYTCEGCDSSCNNQSGFICNQCEDAYYLTSGKCESCSFGCKICTDLQTCTQCQAYTYYSGPDYRGYYLWQNTCFSCSSNCKSCSNSQTCTECLNYSYLDQGYCYSYQRSCQIYTASQKCTQCDSGYYLSQGSCFACSNNCQSCNDSQTCTQCFNSNYLDQGQCYSYQSSCNIYTIDQKCTQCYSGYYLSQSYCFSCSSNCNSCSTYQSCAQCNQGCYKLQDYCYSCSSNCALCGDYQTCTQCNSGFYLKDNYCYSCSKDCQICNDSKSCTQCYNGYLSSGYCQICQTNCQTCMDTQTCTQCLSGYYLSSGECQRCSSNCYSCIDSQKCTKCQNEYYLSTGKCQKCSSNCFSCIDPQTCTSCSSQYYISSGQCQSCPSNCYNCIDSQKCTTCYNQYYLSSGQCKSCSSNCNYCLDDQKCTECQSGYYLSSGLCQICSSHCYSCINSATCKICYSNYYLSSGACQNCSSNCSTCRDSSTCTSCYGNYYLSSGNCSSCPNNCNVCIDQQKCTQCQSGYYQSNGSCGACPSQCNACISQTQCTSCQQGYYLNQNDCLACQSPCSQCLETNDHCTKCITGYYLYGTKCLVCSKPCTDCSSKATYCTACVEPSTQQTPKCNCISPTQYLNSTYTCSDCVSPCLYCSSQNNCLTCIDIHQTIPECNCISGYLMDPNTKMCTLCTYPCLTCETFINQCSSCANTYTYDSVNHTCNCLDNQFEQTGPPKTCKNCIINCQSCQSLSTCQQCKQGYYLNNNECLACDSPCKTCISNPTNCLSCLNGYVINNSGKCTECHQNCKTCIDFYDNCTGCREHYELDNNICSCQIGYYEDQNKCLKCPYPCIECNNPTICVKCASLPQLQILDNKCYCNDGYFWENNYCNQCDQTCQTCITNSKNCITCNKLIFRTLKNNICECQTNYFEDESKQCLSCKSDQAKAVKSCSYQDCQDGMWTYGEECDDGNDVIRDGCSNCKIDKFFACMNEILKKTICMKCPSNCQICQINNSFPECLKCDVGYYVNSLACTKCSDQCLNCESLPSNCNGCRFSKNNETGLCEMCETKPGYYSDFQNNKCYTICGDTFKSSNEECDDGNKIDGDGCDKYCRKEIHYLCKDGICIFPQYPQPTLLVQGKPELYNNLRQFQLSYDQKLKVILDFDINQFLQFYILKGDSKQNIYYSYTVSQNMDSDENNFLILTAEINITLNQSSSNEILLIEFFNYQKIISQLGYPQIQTQVNSTIYEFILIQEDSKSKVEQVTSSGQYVIYSAGAMVGGAVFFGGMDIFYSLLDTIQMLSYFKYVNIQLPFNLQSYFDLFGFLQLSFIGKYINIRHYIDHYIDYSTLKQVPQKIADDQFTPLFIINGMTIVTIWITSIGTFFFAVILKKILANIKLKFNLDNLQDETLIKFRVQYLQVRIFLGKFCKVVVTELFFSGFLRIQIQTAYEFLFSLFLQLSTLQLDSECFMIKLSSQIAVISLGLYLLQIYVMFRISNNAQFIVKNQSLKRKFGSVFEGVNNGYYSRYFNVFLLIKKLLFMGTLLQLYYCPLYQIMMLAIISFIQNILFITVKPFDSSLEFYKQLICEFNIFVTLVLLAVIAIDNEIQYLSYDHRENIGWVCIILISFILFIQLALDGYSQWTLILRKKSALKRIFQKIKKYFKPDPIGRPQPLVLLKV